MLQFQPLKAVGNVYQTVGVCNLVSKEAFLINVWCCSRITFQAGLDIADQVCTRPGEATAEEQQGLFSRRQ